MSELTFESLLTDIDFMKSVFAALEGIRQTEGLTPEKREELQRNQVAAIYSAVGIQITDEQYATIKSYCKDAEATVSSLSEPEAEMLAAGMDALAKADDQTLLDVAAGINASADQMKAFASSLVSDIESE
jgi:hypothetical protein